MYLDNSTLLGVGKQVPRQGKNCEMRGNKLEAVKEQILIRHSGRWIKEAHIPWSTSRGGNKYKYTVDELLEHLAETVMPMVNELKRKKNLPTEAPLKFPSLSKGMVAGTMSKFG